MSYPISPLKNLFVHRHLHSSSFFQRFSNELPEQWSFSTGEAGGMNQNISAGGDVTAVQIGGCNNINITNNTTSQLNTKPADAQFKTSQALKEYRERFSPNSATRIPLLSERMESLKLTKEETEFFNSLLEKFECPLMRDYMHIPVILNERYYNYATIESTLYNQIEAGNKKLIDPFTRVPVTFLEISPCRRVFEDLDTFKKKLDFYRQDPGNFRNYKDFQKAYDLLHARVNTSYPYAVHTLHRV